MDVKVAEYDENLDCLACGQGKDEGCADICPQGDGFTGCTTAQARHRAQEFAADTARPTRAGMFDDHRLGRLAADVISGGRVHGRAGALALVRAYGQDFRVRLYSMATGDQILITEAHISDWVTDDTSTRVPDAAGIAVGDLITGRCVSIGTEHTGTVAEILPPPKYSGQHGNRYRIVDTAVDAPSGGRWVDLLDRVA